MEEEFDKQDPGLSFDFKGFLLRILSYWYLLVMSVLMGLGIAYYINVRKLPVYKLSSLISIKDDQNPFFTSNTSLTFNWGGISDKVNTAVTTLQTRSHNEKVVEDLQFYIQYLQEGEYQKVDVYGQTPFKVAIDSLKGQVLQTPIGIRFLDEQHFELFLDFEEAPGARQAMVYADQSTYQVPLPKQLKKNYQLGEAIDLPFFSGQVMPAMRPPQIGEVFYIQFLNFHSVVNKYQDISVNTQGKNSSVLELSFADNNKQKIVDYLNATARVLSRDMLNRKNLFATKTIRFIDSSLAEKARELEGVEEEMNKFMRENQILDLTAESSSLKNKLNNFDAEERKLQRQLDYYQMLEEYLRSRSDYTNVPAPSVSGIGESNITNGVSKIIALSEQRSSYQYSVKEDFPAYADIDRQIDATKTVLLENIESSKKILQRQLGQIRQEIAQLEGEAGSLPKEQQDLLNIQRRYDISEQTYQLFLSKRNEAGLVKAANVSDVQVIDRAKDTGGGKIGPNTGLNYVLAIIFGLSIPLVFVFLLVFLDNKINTPKDLERLSSIPVLGIIGKSRQKSNLVIYNRPKSSIAESFRGLRTSLQFIYRKKGIEGSKTVLITSSVSGEGKTFCSMNLASVFAISGKKTILLGLDLRKPKIFKDFEISNSEGVVDYLVERKALAEVIQPTNYQNLDVITAGAVPPNPSELLMSERMEVLMRELKQVYDCIIMDTPPVGLVADALNLTRYADATLYMVRQNYTKEGMLKVINEKYGQGEVKNISLVLNYFQQKAKYGYGYDYGYGYGAYGNGYHEEEPKRTWIARLLKKRNNKK